MTAGAATNGADLTCENVEVGPPVGGVARRRRRRLLAPLLLLGGAILLGGCNAPTFGAFRGATMQGHDIFKLWSGMMIAGVVVAAIVWGLIFWAVFRYRRRRHDEIPSQFHRSIPLEIVYTTLPILLVAGIFYYTVVTENEVDAVSPTPAEIVHVTAYRWGWRFAYDDGNGRSQHILIQSSGKPTLNPLPAVSSAYPQLVLPDDATIRIVLISADVVHEMFVPAFDFGRFAQPGVVNRWDFTTTRTGTFRGQCVEYCGLYHDDMLFSVKVVPESQFRGWLTAHGAGASQSGAVS